MVSDRNGANKQTEFQGLTRRDFLLASAGAGAGMLVFGLGGWGPGGQAIALPPDLDIFEEGFPRAFYGRHVEGVARDGGLSFEAFERKYLPLDGIVGKVLNEENYYTGKDNLPFFRQFKAQNPRKMVLLHYNGTGRRATDEATTRFFPGHFLHYKGTRLTQGISSRSQSVLHVQSTSVFKTQRYRTALPDDISVVRMGSDGKPAWGTAEQVRLQSIDARNKTIRVRRGNYNTRTSTFPRGSYLAAHVTTGPYRFNGAPQNNVPLWNYNFSTMCPRDADGRNCGDALADYLWERLRTGTAEEEAGDIAFFDGIIFDVFSWVIRFGNPIQQIDVNTDGRADRGVFGGVDTVSKGALEFFQALRRRLPDKILMSDGHIPSKSQRGFGHLNGMESEGFPDKYDISLDHLSRGENVFNYWKASSADPLNFMNFRYKEDRPATPRNTFTQPTLRQDKSYRKLRLALASAHFTDSAFTASGGDSENGGSGWLPPEVVWKKAPAEPTKVRVFDELWKGTEQEPHWLRQPQGPAVHRAALAPDIFKGEGVSWERPFVGRFRGEGVAFSNAETGPPTMEIKAAGSTRDLSFVSPSMEVTGRDLFVSLRLKADPLENFPASVPRRVSVSAALSGRAASPANREFTWAGGEYFDASFYFQDVGRGRVELRFEVEGQRPVYFEKLKAHSAADGRYREYEGGIVFANPSTRAYTFNVGEIFGQLLAPGSGVKLHRLQGSPNQDPATNNGRLVAEAPPEDKEVPLYPLTLPPKDGLFVVRTGP